MEIQIGLNLVPDKIVNILIMKKIISISIFLLFISFEGFSQFKAVKIESEDIFINFFFKKKQTKYIKNDSTYYLCKTINPSMFLLIKYVCHKKVDAFKYRAVKAKDSLDVRERRRDSTGEAKIYYLKEPYYIGIKLKT